jgi:hypothetical protein
VWRSGVCNSVPDILTQVARLLGLCPPANRRVAGYPVTGLSSTHRLKRPITVGTVNLKSPGVSGVYTMARCCSIGGIQTCQICNRGFIATSRISGIFATLASGTPLPLPQPTTQRVMHASLSCVTHPSGIRAPSPSQRPPFPTTHNPQPTSRTQPSPRPPDVRMKLTEQVALTSAPLKTSV